MKKIILPTIIVALVTSIASVWGFSQFKDFPNNSESNADVAEHPITSTKGATTRNYGAQPVDFSSAADLAVKSVVHIKTLTQGREVNYNDPLARFFGLSPQRYRTPDQRGSGSGVVISKDGYILTNNHVIQGADELKVTFQDNVTKIAKVVGVDPSTDLAVIKIEGDNYPALSFGNSDQVKLGQWVLAVGYPFNLDVTVTAGIVSAKSRNIGVNKKNSNNAIESFIQTDAAVNMGNSGGALVSTDGLLVGINSAIATPTGTYAGYSYAIPANLARKVANDLIKHGNVQRGYMGASLADAKSLPKKYLDQIGMTQQEVDNSNGVILARVLPNSGADKAGLKEGDFITFIDGKAVNTPSQLLEQVAMHSPGDQVKVTYVRDGKSMNGMIELMSGEDIQRSARQSATTNNGVYDRRNQSSRSSATTSQYGSKKSSSEGVGASFTTVPENVLEKNSLSSGVQVAEIDPNGMLAQMTNIEKGFIITSINSQPATSPESVRSKLSSGNSISIEGVYPDRNGRYYFSYEHN